MKGFFNAIQIMIKWFYKSRYRIFSCIFVVILVLPTVTYPLLKNILPSEIDGLIENRNLNKFELSIQNFGANFEKFYQDNFPFRNTLIPLYNKYYYKIYSKYFAENTEHISEWDTDEPVIIESDIAEESVKNEQDTAENSVLTSLDEAKIEEFKRFMNVLVDADNYFNSINKRITFQVCPRKNLITDRVTARTDMDLLSYYISRNSNVSFSYPKNEYLAAALDYTIYDAHNGHHNFLGAYVAWQDNQRKLGIPTTDIRDIDINEFEIDARKVVISPYDVLSCYPYNQDLPDARKTEYLTSINYDVYYKPDVVIETLINVNCYRMEFRSSNRNGLSVFITGDSFLETQVPYAIKDFEYSYISHLYDLPDGKNRQVYRDRTKRFIESADIIVVVVSETNLWSNDLEHNPGLEHRLALLLELTKEIYR